MNKKVTEIRDFGDGKSIVLYTEDNSVYRHLKGWKSCRQVVPYSQNGRVIAVDLQFPKEAKDHIRKAVGLPVKAGR